MKNGDQLPFKFLIALKHLFLDHIHTTISAYHNRSGGLGWLKLQEEEEVETKLSFMTRLSCASLTSNKCPHDELSDPNYHIIDQYFNIIATNPVVSISWFVNELDSDCCPRLLDDLTHVEESL